MMSTKETFDACRAAARELSKLSRERVADELMKLLSAVDPVYAVQEMIEADVFANIVDEIDPGAGPLLAVLILREEAYDIPPDPVRRLVALLPKDADKTAENCHQPSIFKEIAPRCGRSVENLETGSFKYPGYRLSSWCGCGARHSAFIRGR